MDITINTDTVLEKIEAKMLTNLKNNGSEQGLSEEEINATIVLNKKKISIDAQNLANFFIEAISE